MNKPTIWYQDFTRHSQRQRDAFLQSLAAIKAQLQPKKNEDRTRYGLILVDEESQINAILPLVEIAFRQHEKTIIILFKPALHTPQIIWNLLHAGASEVLDFENTLGLAQIIEEKLRRWETIESLLNSPFVQEYLVGESLIWKNILREMIEIAVYTQSSVLIVGESGTGKEMLSKLIHHFDTRPTKADLVLVDCTTISPELSGSEFFGHEKGAFTGAISSRDGAFTLANQGTLFIDEIGELPLRLQAELLRVVQEGIYKPVGSNVWKKTLFRLVGATNRLLHNEVTEGRFRLDLYYRLSSWICKVPSLNQRREDIPLLAKKFFQKAFKNQPLPVIDELVFEYLSKRDYQGNVRELQQLIQRIAYRHVGKGIITLADIPLIDRPHPIVAQECAEIINDEYQNALQNILLRGLTLKEIRDLTTETAIELALKNEKGRVTQAALRLGITNRAIQLRKSKKAEE